MQIKPNTGAGFNDLAHTTKKLSSPFSAFSGDATMSERIVSVHHFWQILANSDLSTF